MREPPVSRSVRQKGSGRRADFLANLLRRPGMFGARQPALRRWPQAPNVEEHRQGSGRYISNVVYGGLDGILTSFTVVSGIAGASLSTRIILVLGLANLFADGFAMAVGAYLSAQSQREYYQGELQREAWEVEHFPEVEKAEMYEIYKRRGYSEDEAGTLVRIHSRDSQRWVRVMMEDELGMLPQTGSVFVGPAATWVAFVLAGLAPLSIYLIGLAVDISSGLRFPIAVALSALALFTLGAAKVLITRRNPLRSGLEMMAVGGLAGGLAYGIGALLKGSIAP